jgi:hypothetical protein
MKPMRERGRTPMLSEPALHLCCEPDLEAADVELGLKLDEAMSCRLDDVRDAAHSSR